MTKKAVIFDMDGVLVDNRELHIDSFIEFGKRYGINVTRENLMPFFGMGNSEIFPHYFGNDLTAARINELADEKEAIYREMFEKTIVPTKGLVKLLEELKSRGVKIAVGSSGMRKNVNFVLEKCQIKEYFDAISDGDNISKAKPDPEVFNIAMSKLGVKPEESIIFEDSFAGIKAARNAGVDVIALATTFPREDHKDYDMLIDDFTQIDAETVINFIKKN